MSQTLFVVVLFVAGMAALPWLVRRIQQRQAGAGLTPGSVSRVVAAVAVGPHQKVVTVEVGPEHARTTLILGVTAQQITCLHVLGSKAEPSTAVASAGFAQEIRREQAAQASLASGGVAHVP